MLEVPTAHAPCWRPLPCDCERCFPDAGGNEDYDSEGFYFGNEHDEY